MQLRVRSTSSNILVTRAQARARSKNLNHYITRAEHTMNQISVETSVVETETNEQTLAIAQKDAIVELSATQLILVGGGTGVTVLI
jgi:molybdopterin biosynthesis enzyme MoaB